MKSKRLVGIAGKSIVKNKMRTLLTMLGIIIGVAAVIVMVAIGAGAQRQIERLRKAQHHFATRLRAREFQGRCNLRSGN